MNRLYNSYYTQPNRLLPQPSIIENNTRFQSTDSEEQFKYNLKIQPADWKYRTKEVLYSANSQCYRAPEWTDIDWGESVVILGCSYVYGIGLAEDETISSQLQNILKRPVVNLGVPSSGPTFAMHNSILLNKNFTTPWAVVSLWSDWYRIHEFVNENHINHYTATSDHTAGSFPCMWGNSIVNPEMHSYFSIIATREIWKSKTRYKSYSFWEPIEDTTKAIRQKLNDYARDMGHPGSESAVLAATMIAEDLLGV
jgi:hypothetical protein